MGHAWRFVWHPLNCYLCLSDLYPIGIYIHSGQGSHTQEAGLMYRNHLHRRDHYECAFEQRKHCIGLH